VDFAFEAAVVLFLVAFRTGAFSAPERLASGFGRASVFASNLRFFAGEALEPPLVTGRADGLFVLLLTDSLMPSSIIKMTPVSGSRKRPQFSIAYRINQRGSVSCGYQGAFAGESRGRPTKKNS
jgi:hypothetical protein